jgi:hypothetical protein
VTTPLLYTPTFFDTQIVRFSDLNALSYDIDALSQITLGRPLASGASTKPLCKVNLTANKSVANNATAGASGAAEVIAWDHALFDTDGMFTTAGGPTYVQIQTPGWYWICLQVQWASGAGPARVTQIAVNGTADPLNVVSSANTLMGSSGVMTQQAIAYEHLNTGAAVYGMSFQNSGSALNMLANGNWGTYMSVVWADPF